MTKNIQVSFRLSPYQLAHGLEILRGLEPGYQPSSMTAMVKMIYEDWIAKMSAATKPWPSNESQQAVKRIMEQTAAGRRQASQGNTSSDLARIMSEKDTRQKESPSPSGRPIHSQAPVRELETSVIATQTGRFGSEGRNESNAPKTASVTKIVTDFSPPSLEELAGEGDGE